MCSEGGLPSEMQELELAIHRHQSLYEQVTQAYTEVRLPGTTFFYSIEVNANVNDLFLGRTVLLNSPTDLLKHWRRFTQSKFVKS